MYLYMYMYEGWDECANFRSFADTPTLIFTHVLLYNLNVWYCGYMYVPENCCFSIFCLSSQSNNVKSE